VSGARNEALDAIEGVEGWLSAEQATRLFDRASAVPGGGTIVEIGSFRGRSTIVLARGAAPDVTVIAIDPFAGNDRGPREWEGREAEAERDQTVFEANLTRAGVRDRVRHLRLTSSQALAHVNQALDLVYVDGAHDYRGCRADLLGWAERVRPGGTLLIHDAFASVGVTLAILRTLALDPDFAYVGRSRSLAEYRRSAAPLSRAARRANLARQLAELPWFARNVAIKLALVDGRRELAVRLGHAPEDAWPY
jgi:predicted O-methyltransferase YrrM